MRAAQINEYGTTEVLKYTNSADKPEAGIGQVLVQVKAASVNPFDAKVLSGSMRQMFDLPMPATLGGDCAGLVVAIGERVSGFEVGQAVYGQANAIGGAGSFAEFTVVKAESLSAKPGSVDFLTAAALPLVSVSAYQALVDHMALQPGQKILIHGGAGGIGSLAVQLAKHLGAYVSTTVSAHDFEYVQSLGADEAIDYKAQDFTAVVADYDAVFDPVGGETNKKSYGVLKPGGALVSMVEDVDTALAEQLGIHYTHEFTKVTSERLAEIAELVDSGVLKVNVDTVFPLEQAAEAVDYLQTSHPRGKVVIQVEV